ncbi:MAG: GntR family transcriptional regulator [Holophaga sp.]|nr:GntR family transcriptional regulator [Holophaga sp.]
MTTDSFVQPLQTRSLREQVYEYLREAMNHGELQPGAFLDLNAIAGRLGISRTPLREALLQLEAQGFVTVLARRGFRLNSLTLDDIRHYYEIIGALEAATLRDHGAALTGADLQRMRALNDAMGEAIAGNDFDRYYDLNLAFHDTYLGLSDNKALLALVGSLKQRLYDWPRRSGFIKTWEEHSIAAEHTRFLDLLERGALREAAAFLQEVHWSFQVQEHFIHDYYFAPQPQEPA